IAARYFRSAGVTLLRNREITEDRATTLSLLGTLEGLVWAVTPLIWGIVIQAVGLRIVFLLAGVSSLISSVIFSIALSSRES
ncbi:MAG TPA: MFS transporter, partial [Firmicutes bacterium]|nr:MFS transporter [Candidatus Fermentithermobacillaceae bacterium]